MTKNTNFEQPNLFDQPQEEYAGPTVGPRGLGSRAAEGYQRYMADKAAGFPKSEPVKPRETAQQIADRMTDVARVRDAEIAATDARQASIDARYDEIAERAQRRDLD